jgi:flavin-dependent dehydrogenase
MDGRVAAKAVEEGDASALRLSEYVRQFEEAWGRQIRYSRKTLELVGRLGDGELNMLAQVLTGEDVRALSSGKEFYRVMARIVQRSPMTMAKLMTSYITKR